MKILSADFLLPVSSDVVAEGAVAVNKTKIAAAGTKRELIEKFPEAEREDFGEAVIMPGFVNAHSHLEITAMRGFLDDAEKDFYSWLIKLTKTRAEKLTIEDIETAAIFGALEGARAGVTCFADIGRCGKAGLAALKENGLRGVVFQETEFSPKNETAKNDFAELKDKFLELKEGETNLVKIGISPHAPYTVSRKLFEEISAYALAENVKLSIHAAESSEERDLMLDGAGFFAETYKNLNLEWKAPRVSSIEFLSNLGVLQTKPLLAHCVKVSERDVDLIAETDSRVAHCPKSNAKFGHGVAPLEKFLDKKIRVGFGSDSVASNNICDLLEEARFAALFARGLENKKRFLPASEIIKTATLGGARALGLEREIGTLEAGKQADLIVVSLDAVSQMPVFDIDAALLFASNGRDVKMTMVAGEEIYRNGLSRRVDEIALKEKIKEIGRRIERG